MALAVWSPGGAAGQPCGELCCIRCPDRAALWESANHTIRQHRSLVSSLSPTVRYWRGSVMTFKAAVTRTEGCVGWLSSEPRYIQ